MAVVSATAILPPRATAPEQGYRGTVVAWSPAAIPEDGPATGGLRHVRHGLFAWVEEHERAMRRGRS